MTRGGVLLRFVAALAAALAAAVLAGAAAAQDYPSRAITLVVPFAIGSGIDPTARIIGDELSGALKQPVVLDHKPGANGAIAASAVARAAPDGYTIFMECHFRTGQYAQTDRPAPQRRAKTDYCGSDGQGTAGGHRL